MGGGGGEGVHDIGFTMPVCTNGQLEDAPVGCSTFSVGHH